MAGGVSNVKTIPELTIRVEKDAVGHIATALTRNGEIIASANGFGAKDARRKLNAILKGTKYVRIVVPRKRKSRKMHNPSGVILAAKQNIERYIGYKARRSGK